MDFTLDPEIEDARHRVRAFIREQVLPHDTDPSAFDEHQHVREDLLAKLRGNAKAAGLWAPQMPKARGGMGLPVVGMAAVYEEANWSLFGPASLNCAAPDD